MKRSKSFCIELSQDQIYKILAGQVKNSISGDPQKILTEMIAQEIGYAKVNFDQTHRVVCWNPAETAKRQAAVTALNMRIYLKALDKYCARILPQWYANANTDLFKYTHR